MNKSNAPASLCAVHRASAAQPNQAEAMGVRAHLIEGGIAAAAVSVRAESASPSATPAASGSDTVLRSLLMGGLLGTAIGGGLGALGTLILTAGQASSPPQSGMRSRRATRR